MRYFIITDQIKLSDRPEGPLADYLHGFADHLEAEGYKVSSIQRRVYHSGAFSRWLKQKKVDVQDLNAGHIKGYLQHCSERGSSCQGVIYALEPMLGFLRREGVLSLQKTAKIPLSPVESCLQAYEHYLREDRALADASIIAYRACTRSFLERRFGKKAVTLSDLNAADVVSFIQFQASRLQTKRAKLMTCALRSFLKYARYSGEIKQDLAVAVPSVANWSMSSIPRAISAGQVSQLLESIDQSTPIGHRDYAILLLLARLGLRACEIAFLELDNIDWHVGTLTVRTKGGHPSEYPLSGEIGAAIAAYLHRGRPSSTSRRVFLRSVAPARGFGGASSIGAVVKHRLERTTIQSPTRGAHQFRHGVAVDMLRRGASLGEIGDLLGHHCAQSTMIYAKTDIETLRSLAMPWPGEML